MIEPATEHAGYEMRDISVRTVAWFALCLSLTIVVVGLATVGLYKAFEAHHPSPDAPSRIAFQPHMLAPPPRLQANPALDLEAFQAAEEKKLNSYGWVDRKKGAVRIPIERAMDLIVERGLPTREPGTQNASSITSVQMQERKAAEGESSDEP